MFLTTDPLVALGFFVLGTTAASFIGLVAARLSTGAPIVNGRSVCDACSAKLSPYALVPIFSWLFGAGRCFVCKSRFSALGALTEFMLGALFALAYLQLGLSFALLFLLITLTLLMGLVLYDLAHHILPFALLAPFVATSVTYGYFASCGFALPTVDCLLATVSTALIVTLFVALIHFGSLGRAMGFADIPLTFGLALIAGPLALSGLLYAFWIGGGIGIILLSARAIGARIESEVPFAPFLASGFLLAYFTQWDIFALLGLAL